jgi:hypothetical protein
LTGRHIEKYSADGALRATARAEFTPTCARHGTRPNCPLGFGRDATLPPTRFAGYCWVDLLGIVSVIGIPSTAPLPCSAKSSVQGQSAAGQLIKQKWVPACRQRCAQLICTYRRRCERSDRPPRPAPLPADSPGSTVRRRTKLQAHAGSWRGQQSTVLTISRTPLDR